MPEIEFLSFPISSIRRSIKDIEDSYRNPWDIYAELTQNSVDAIRRMQKNQNEKGKINIIANAQNKSISISDNGCGISKYDLPRLLQLFSSGKENDQSSVGEKGVGLKFVFFQSSYFRIESSDGTTGGVAVIKDARYWKKLTTEDLLKLDFTETAGQTRGTTIILEGIELAEDEEQAASVFQLTAEQLVFVLRNRTYLGETTYLWEEPQQPIEIILNYTDYNGVVTNTTVKNEYVTPIDSLSEKDYIDLDQFETWLHQADRSDTDKRNKLQGKVLITKGSYLHNGYRKINYWACFVPTRRDWDNINKVAKLLPNADDITDDWQENHAYCMFNHGIFTATKGMPTGISIDSPNTGYAGYWPNCFMIFQDDALTFDIGRKSIHGKTQLIYQSKAKEIFAKITKYVTKYTSATPLSSVISSSSFDRYNIRQEISKLVDLNSNKVKFQKIPSEQEASVSAIFFELIGSGKIADLEPIYLGYRNKYDLYAYYISSEEQHLFKFVEFKSHLKNITKDFSEARKVFDEMDYIVCWDVNDSDVQELSNFGISCEEIEQGTLHTLECPQSVTHRLSIPNCNPVYVIDLKKLM